MKGVGGSEAARFMRIVPAVLVGMKKKPKRPLVKGPGGGTVPDCLCFPPSLQDGIWMQYDGNPILATGMPATGGPWMLALYGNGQAVWVNAAGCG